MAITKEQIWSIASALTEAGKNPTLAVVREQLGGGSYTDISAAMQIWRQNQQASSNPIREPAPTSITERLNDFGSDLWAVALELANNRLQSEREALEQARQETETIRRETTSLADQLTSEIENLKIELLAHKDQIAQSRKESENARVAEQACQARLESSLSDIENLKAQVKEERETAKKAIEAAAELRGRLGAFEEITKPKPVTEPIKTKAATGSRAAKGKNKLDESSPT